MTVRTTLLLLTTILLASCSEESLVGDWRCEDTVVEHEYFTVNTENRVTLSDDGSYLTTFDITFDFPGTGTVFVTQTLTGTWRLADDVLTYTTEQVDVKNFETDTSIGEEVVADVLSNQYPSDEVSRYSVAVISSHRVQMVELGESLEAPFFCDRLSRSPNDG